MDTVALIVRLLIAATFCLAGIAKLADLEQARKGIREFGVPDWAASPLKILLPLAELTAAVLLIPLSTELWGALAAITLLLAFVAGISFNLALGRKPECNCFGQLHSRPIGWATLARNGVFIGGAGFVLWDARNGAPMSVVAWTATLTAGETTAILLGIAAFFVIAGEGWLTFHLLRQNGRLLLRMDALEAQVVNAGIASLPAKAPAGLPIGSSAPSFELPALSGSIVTLDILRAERRPVVLIFSDPNCGPCSALLPEIARWQSEHAATLTIALIGRGSERANQVKIGEHRLSYVLLQKDREVAAAYQANGTPAAVLVGRDGHIESFLAMGPLAIAGLIASGAGAMRAPLLPTNGKYAGNSTLPAGPVELKIGQLAPSLKLPDLSGKIVDLSLHRERETLVLFWNPGCGFCARMLPDLRLWEDQRSMEAPQLLVVSSGTVEENRAMGLRSTVVLDKNFASGLAFQVRGTPAALLVDTEGRIASGVASGAAAVFALANAKQAGLAGKGR